MMQVPTDGPSRISLRIVLDAMSELVLVRNRSGHLVEVNQAFLTAFGGTRDDWLGRWFAAAPGPDEGQSVRRYDVAMGTLKGEAWIEWSETQLDDGGILAVGRDVTEERSSRKLLNDAAQGKSVFFAAVTHELRTPLSGALGAARLLKDTQLEPDQQTYVDGIQSSTQHALALIDDILDLSRLEAGHFELREEPVDLRRLIEDNCELLATRAAEKGLSLAHMVSPDIPAFIMADPARLRQVLFNLVGNAVKFTDSGGVLIHVALAGDQLRISVKDSGPGITSDDQARIFERFERGSTGSRVDTAGTGLGLAMVKGLAQAMSGEVGLSSTPGKGSTFWFTFPVTVSDPARLERELEGMRVVIASPYSVQREALERMASELGASAEAVSSRDRIQPSLERHAGDQVLILDESWAGEASHMGIETGRLRILILARPNTKDRFSKDARPDGVHGWLVTPVRCHSLIEFVLKGRDAVRPEEPKDQTPDKPLDGMQILLAEDDPVNGLIAEAVLTRLGGVVSRVMDGDAAIEKLSQSEFDFALLDMRMPKRDGCDVALAVRALPSPLGHVPMLALTANATPVDRETCLASGMNDFLTKPLDPGALVKAVNALCQPQNTASVG